MGVHKIRRVIHAPGTVITGVGSFADIDVRSTQAMDSLTVVEVGSFAGVNVSSNTVLYQLTGNDRFRGVATIALSGSTITISAAAISSGNVVVLTAQGSVHSLRVSSIVDDISFMAEVGDDMEASVNLSYLILE